MWRSFRTVGMARSVRTTINTTNTIHQAMAFASFHHPQFSSSSLSSSLVYLNLYKNKYPTPSLHHQSASLLHTSATLDAGHAKWQNIKHIKAAKDAQKSQLYNRLVVKIKVAVQKQGGSDPHLNREFADVLEMCRKANMPNSTIDKAVKRALEKRFTEVRFEIIGPENSLLVIDAEVENRNHFRNQLRQILKREVGFGFANEGRALSAFEEKGVVRVRNVKTDSPFDISKAEEIAIEAEAEEVRVDDDDDTVLLFIGEPLSYTRVKAYIETNHSDEYAVVEFGTELLPYARTEISETTGQVIANVIAEIDQLEGVNRVYTNV